MAEKPAYRELEELLRDETSRWRLLADQSRDGIVVLDQNGRVFEVNKRFADMLGYSMEEKRHDNRCGAR